MARSLFGGRVGDTVASLYNLGNRQVFTLPVDANGDPSSVTLQVWDAVGGTQLTDLLAADGTTPITVVTVPASGQVPEFYGPDGVNVAVYVKDPDDDFYRLDARADVAAQVAADAQAAAEAAQAAAEAVGNTNDTIIAGRINDPASATASALSASFVATLPPPTGVVAVDTLAVQGGIDAANAAGGGVVQLQDGVYITSTLNMKSFVTLRGHGEAATTIRLAPGTDADLLTVENFAGLTGTTSAGGALRFKIEALTLDGNRTNQSGTSWAFRIYGAAYDILNVTIQSGLTGCAYTEYYVTADTALSPSAFMEAHWTNVRITDWTMFGLVHKGPHDSLFSGIKIVGQIPNTFTPPAGSTGLIQGDNTGGDEFVNVHIWGRFDVAAQLEHSAFLSDCYFEGGYVAQLRAWSSNIHGSAKLFNANNRSGSTALVVGQSGNKVTGLNLDLWIDSRNGSVIDMTGSNGRNTIRGTWTKGTATTLYAGSGVPTSTDVVDIVCTDDSAFSARTPAAAPARIQSLRPGGGIQVETFDSSTGALSSQNILSSGRLTLAAIHLDAGTVVNSIAFLAGGTAAASPTNQWFALYDADLNRLGVTADGTTGAWGTFSRKQLALSSPYTITKSGLYYLGIMVAAGTVPSIAGFGTYPNIRPSGPLLCGYDGTNTGLTTPAGAPATAAALTALSTVAYAQVS